MYSVKVNKITDFQFSGSLLGVQVSGILKGIVNKVMCVTEVLGLHIYYQGSDPMHTRGNLLETLVSAYK